MWNEEIIIVKQDQIDKFPIKPKTKEALKNGMILESGELSFEYLQNDLETVNAMWNLEDSHFDKFVSIGFNSSGDPLAIDLNNNDQIIYLNHDNNFERVFINQNIEKLILSIIRTEKFQSNLKPHSKSSLINSDFTDEEFKILKEDLRNIDSQIFESNSFWVTYLDDLIWFREDVKKVDNIT
jgi:hypothetical protein